MRQSKLFTKTLREPPKDEVAVNAQLLERAGFVFKNSAGIYSYLPLGWRVIKKIADIVREEMNVIGGQEVFMPAMVEKKYLSATNRWDIDIGYRLHNFKGGEENFAAGWTHEEVLTSIAIRYINSYKDLPFSAYQIQTKFRNEPRAKSGLLRGREFLMKDLYSFHESEDGLNRYYDEVKDAYFNIFNRIGLDTMYTIAPGGDFTSSNTHEFQVIADVGEDTIFHCKDCEYAENSETEQIKSGDPCPRCGSKLSENSSIEVGNIFPLGTKYSSSLGLKFTDRDGVNKDVFMGSYGIGLGRVMGAVVEVYHDNNGIIWPESVAPYSVHLLALSGAEDEADIMYKKLVAAGFGVLYDDRSSTAGEKLMDSDLIGLPYRVLISSNTLKRLDAEIKHRAKDKEEYIKLENVVEYLEKSLS